uniref:Rho guanine nucleotide exchange factor (GEF) 40 n=1 Tax=Oryzias latipes TaxID=8090 RepID=A0A3P9JPM8_ORYLA
MGSEAMEDCVQGALSSLYPPFESTAPPLLSQVFSVLESTYQQDSLRYLLDYFVPAKHLLHKLQQHACSQYLGCLFLHSGWPLCLGEKVVVQLSTLDWRLLRSNDFYLQVVPFSTRCPRLALKCLAAGGRTVQEILVPESQHPLVFTSEWLHSVNKERGHRREVGGGLDTCLVSTSDGVVRLPWKEIVYPKFIHDPSEEVDLLANKDSPMSKRLPSEGGSSLGGWGDSSSGELDSWSWDEEEDDASMAHGLVGDPALRRRSSEDGLGRTARQPQLDGDYVELLELRGGPDGRVDNRQRYLEMHGISKTKTLPLCRRGKAIKLRKGKAWGHWKMERSGSFRAIVGARGDLSTTKEEVLPPQPLRGVAETGKGRRPCSAHDSDEGNKVSTGSAAPEISGICFGGPRRPGVGRERDSSGVTHACSDRRKDSQSSDNLLTIGIHGLNHKPASEGQSDQGSQSDSVFEDSDKRLSWDSDPATPTSDAPQRPLAQVCVGQNDTCSGSTTKNLPKPKLADDKDEGKTEDRACPRGKDIKTAGFRAPRRRRKGKGARGRARSGGRPNQKASKVQGKASQASPPSCSASAKHSNTEKTQPEQTELADGEEGGPTTTAEAKQSRRRSRAETETESLCHVQSGTSCPGPLCGEPCPAEAHPDLQTRVSSKEPVLLRQLDAELLQSGVLQLTGTVDRLGRALVFTEAGSLKEGFCVEEAAQILACFHRITRPTAREKGLTVLLDSRRFPPSDLCLSALKRFQALVPGGLGSVLVLVEEQEELLSHTVHGTEVHLVKGTAVLQQYVDKQQLLKELDGDFSHSHSDWLAFRLRLESLAEHCESALCLLGEAQQELETEPMPDDIKAVPQSIDKHRRLMANVLADQRLTELQQRGGAWLAGLTNCSSGLGQKSPDCRAALAAASQLYDSVDHALHQLVQVSNQRGRNLEALGQLAGLVDKLEKCDKEIEEVQLQLEDYRDPPLSLSRLSLKQQKFRTFRETVNELHSETLAVLSDLEGWNQLNWAGLSQVQIRLPPVREKLRDMSHCLSDCWTTLDHTQRLLSTLTEATQWCDAVCSASSTCPLSSLPPIPPHVFRMLGLWLWSWGADPSWTSGLRRWNVTSRLLLRSNPGFFSLRGRRARGSPKHPPSPASGTCWALTPRMSGGWGLEEVKGACSHGVPWLPSSDRRPAPL